MWLRIPLPYCPYAPDMGGSISQSTLQQMEQLARSVMWRAKYRQPRFWRTLWSTDFYRTRLFGPTCEPSTLALGVEAWISSLRAIRANHSQSPESVVAKAIRATCGQKWLESWRNANSVGYAEDVTLPENELRSLLFALSRASARLREREAGVQFRGKVWGDGSCTGIIINPVHPYDINVRSLLDMEVEGRVRPAEER